MQVLELDLGTEHDEELLNVVLHGQRRLRHRNKVQVKLVCVHALNGLVGFEDVLELRGDRPNVGQEELKLGQNFGRDLPAILDLENLI